MEWTLPWAAGFPLCLVVRAGLALGTQWVLDNHLVY